MDVGKRLILDGCDRHCVFSAKTSLREKAVLMKSRSLRAPPSGAAKFYGIKD
jgi:hypothetical protein